MAIFLRNNAVRIYAVVVALVALAVHYSPNLPVDLILAVVAALLGEPVHRVASANPDTGYGNPEA